MKSVALTVNTATIADDDDDDITVPTSNKNINNNDIESNNNTSSSSSSSSRSVTIPPPRIPPPPLPLKTTTTTTKKRKKTTTKKKRKTATTNHNNSNKKNYLWNTYCHQNFAFMCLCIFTILLIILVPLFLYVFTNDDDGNNSSDNNSGSSSSSSNGILDTLGKIFYADNDILVATINKYHDVNAEQDDELKLLNPKGKIYIYYNNNYQSSSSSSSSSNINEGLLHHNRNIYDDISSPFLVKLNINGLQQNCVNCRVAIHKGKSCSSSVGMEHWRHVIHTGGGRGDGGGLGSISSSTNNNIDDEISIGNVWKTTSINDLDTGNYIASYGSNNVGYTDSFFIFNNGYSLNKNVGHTIVIYNGKTNKTPNEQIIGCGVLERITKNSNELQYQTLSTSHTKILPYPTTNNNKPNNNENYSKPSGTINVDVFKNNNVLRINTKLLDLESNCINCGIHIHEGIDNCDNANTIGGHYWKKYHDYNLSTNNPEYLSSSTSSSDNSESFNDRLEGYIEGNHVVTTNNNNGKGDHATTEIKDPWGGSNYYAIYNSNIYGVVSDHTFYIYNGYNFDLNNNHVVIIHSQDGTRIGCGVLRPVE